jgi:hypothetical protein
MLLEKIMKKALTESADFDPCRGISCLTIHTVRYVIKPFIRGNKECLQRATTKPQPSILLLSQLLCPKCQPNDDK